MAASSNSRWLAAAALLIAVYGGALYYEMMLAPAGCCGLTWPNTDAVQAGRILQQTDPKGANPVAQRNAARIELAARPGDAAAWVRLAYADRIARPHLSKEGLKAFDNSYLTAVYGGNWAPWRIVLALDSWQDLPVHTRVDVVHEIGVVLRDPALQNTARTAALAVQNPAGRLAAIETGLIPFTFPATPSRH